MNDNVHPTFRPILDAIAPKVEPRKPPYPFCSHPDKCINGRCERTVKGEPWSCAD